MKKQFSIWIFLLTVVVLSWPFQFWFVFRADTSFDKYLYSSLSMCMVAVGAFIAGRWLFKDGFEYAGWHWGKPIQYIWVLLFALMIWLVPAIIENRLSGKMQLTTVSVFGGISLFAAKFASTLIPAFGEEFGWRGYMLSHLVAQHGVKRGLLVHAFIWWCWHLPVLVGMGLKETVAGSSTFINLLLVLFISIIPSMLHAVIFAFVWSKTKSLAVATVYHAAFDEVRDTLGETIGFGTFTESWQMVVIIIAGVLLFWKADWKKLLNKGQEAERFSNVNYQKIHL